MKPNIRFKEFSSDYIESTIGDRGTFCYGKSAPKWSVSEDAPTPCIRYGELYTTYKENIYEIKSRTNTDKKNLVFSKGNEVLVPRVGEDPLDFCKCSNLPFKDIAVGEMISIYTPKDNPLYISYYFNSKMKYEFAKRVEGGNVSNLYYNYLYDIKTFLPSDEKEQIKVANFLEVLSKKIEEQKKYIEELQKFNKKIYMDIFEKEIKFPEFNEEWKDCTLKDLLDYIADNRGKNPDYYTKEGIPVIDNFMIKNNLYPDLKMANRYIDEQTYNKFIRKEIEKDDVLITLVGNGIGNIALAPEDKSVIIQNTLGLRAKKGINKRFIYHCLYYNNRNIKLLDRGMAQPSIRQDELLDLNLFIPSDKNEIEKITKLFDCLSRKLELENNKLHYLEKYKKGIMQNIFA